MKRYLTRSMMVLGALGMMALVVLLAHPAAIQAQTTGTTPVTDDQVNKVASKLYCPVCENISLDTCGTAACAQWRDEIRIQLQSGKTEQQVIDDFVARYGDRVVGTPQDPTLRALSLVTPWVISALALLAAAYLFIRWRLELQRAALQAADDTVETDVQTPTLRPAAPASPQQVDQYRERLERDLALRR